VKFLSIPFLTYSKQGLIKPVVCIEPRQVGDVTISCANGINMKFLSDWHLEKGVFISLIRSGEVIPRLKSVEGIEIPYRENFKTQGEYEYCYRNRVASLEVILSDKYNTLDPSFGISKKCPCCGSELKWTDTGVDQYCPNEFCFDRVAKQLEYFFSTIGVTKVGPITCQYLLEYVRKGIERNFTDSLKAIFELTSSVHCGSLIARE